MEKKKLLVFHTLIAPYRKDFFNSLSEHFHMKVCIDKDIKYESLYDNLDDTYRFKYDFFSTSIGFRKVWRYVVEQIREQNPQTILVSECGLVSLIVVLYKILGRKKFRIVSIVDDSYNMLIEKNQFSRKHEIAEKILIPRFDDIINVEPRVVSFFQNKYKKGVFFPIIRNEIIYRKELKEALPISHHYVDKYALQGKRVVLFVGRFVALKNVPSLIKAVKSLNDENVRLVLVGAGPEENTYKKLANDSVIFAGKLSGLELYAWYNVAHILVLPSTQEAFGAVTNEALMSGCKCVVSKRAGSSCLIKDGENGYVFDPNNEQDLIDKLTKITKSNFEDSNQIKNNTMPFLFDDVFKNVTNIL